MEFKGFFKNTSMGRGEQMKMEVSRQKRKNREKSRHEMRQAFRHMSDTEDENEPPTGSKARTNGLRQPGVKCHQQMTTTGRSSTSSKQLTAEERYLIRLNRLQQFRDQKRRLQQEEKANQKVAFVPFVGNAEVKPKAAALTTVDGGARKLTPLRERQEQAANVVPKAYKTPVICKKTVKARVDCWRTQESGTICPTVADGTEPRSRKKEKQHLLPVKSAERPVPEKRKKVSKRVKETQIQNAPKIVLHAVVGPPQAVLEKTRYYYDKVDSELTRLQTLCDQYAPFLEAEHELNDHCRGLVLAAQGQTNILINKKLTKFRTLIEHYEQKWSDQKVRHDDLDGFWLMVSLDLENLDKRFEELRTLKENAWQVPEEPQQPKVKKLQTGGGIRKRDKKPAKPSSSSSVIANLIRKARQEQQKQKATLAEIEPLKETVTVVTSPVVRRSVRFGKTPDSVPKRKRSSLLPTGSTPTIVDWAQDNTSRPKETSKHRTIYPEIISTKAERSVKSILKTPRVEASRRAKSVLFLDSGLETPQTRRRHSSRTIVDTPKPKIKFNDQLEIEHIDRLEARTPSRLDVELEKRRQRSLIDSIFASGDPSRNGEDEISNHSQNPLPRGTPRRSIASKKQPSSTRRSSRKLSALFDAESDNINYTERERGSAKRLTRSTANARKHAAPMATIPIFSPKIPFLGQIPGGLSPGRMVRVKGMISNHGERCQIHIQSGAAVNPRDDVTLQISIRPNQHAIVRNSIQNQVVGQEESYGGCPIRYGETFDLLILAEVTQYKLAINGVHFCTFPHRLPLHNARFISVSGGVAIYSIISEADHPGSVPVNPYPPAPPPIVQYPTPYAPPIGFVPNAPPSTLPPPPPYTPLPTHPIGGGGHYPGIGIYPPPPPPPQPGYPHHPPPGAHPPAVPFSVLFKEELQAKIEQM
uniref:Galectin domain-containing protein n=1 Tax=Anopheles dirus TaxID=7168 RepID=A0A182NT14_9DIPT